LLVEPPCFWSHVGHGPDYKHDLTQWKTHCVVKRQAGFELDGERGYGANLNALVAKSFCTSTAALRAGVLGVHRF